MGCSVAEGILPTLFNGCFVSRIDGAADSCHVCTEWFESTDKIRLAVGDTKRAMVVDSNRVRVCIKDGGSYCLLSLDKECFSSYILQSNLPIVSEEIASNCVPRRVVSNSDLENVCPSSLGRAILNG